MDGVLLDSEPLHYKALSDVLRSQGHEWSREQNEQLLGTTVEDSFRIIAETVPLSVPVEAFVPVYNARILEVLKESLDPAPGVPDLLEALTEAAVPLAVASSSLRSWVEATLASLEIARYFQAVVAGDEIDRGKPAPDIYLRAAGHLGISPDRCVAIEDAPNGVLSAKAAGMKVIAVETPYTSHLSLNEPDLQVAALTELQVRPVGVGTVCLSHQRPG